MATMNRAHDNRALVMWVAVGLALAAALAYLLIGWKFLAVGDLQSSEGPQGIIYAAAGSYLVGGMLILLRRRWLLVAGAVLNALVILFFVQLYIDRPSVMFSAGGLISKAAQLLLEASLVYLIIADWRRERRRASW